jgi:hypothetical protein
MENACSGRLSSLRNYGHIARSSARGFARSLKGKSALGCGQIASKKAAEGRAGSELAMRVNHPAREVDALAAIGSDTTSFLKNTLSLNKCFFSWT